MSVATDWIEIITANEKICHLLAELAAYEAVMPACGHKQRYVVSDDEGTSNCLMCISEHDAEILRMIMAGELTPIIGTDHFEEVW